MNRSTFAVARMDCASEERLVRMALSGDPSVRRIDVDLSAREATIYHEGEASPIASALGSLNLGANLVGTEAVGALPDEAAGGSEAEVRTLKIVLAINAGMFVAEFSGGYLAESTGLIADSLDMFADAAVYGISLYGAARSAAGQRSAARLSGYVQLFLAISALGEVIRRSVMGSEPEAQTMALVGSLALVANVTCMWLLARHRKGGAHMKASWIFTTNDVIANLGVIVAAGLVTLTASSIPDLVVGSLIAVVVLLGARRILKLAR